MDPRSCELDRAIITAFSPKSRVIQVEKHGKTNWSHGLKVDVETDGVTRSYFVKITGRKIAVERVVEMACGEFRSQNALVAVLPDNVAAAIAHGPLANNPKHSFLLTEFKSMRTEMIPPEVLAPILQRLHKATSPTGKFGFLVPTFKGYVPVNNSWCDTWEQWFARQFRCDIDWAQKERGYDAEFQQVSDEFLAKVVPRLLRPLQSGGNRGIEPVLCHGDLWHGNIELENGTQNPILFDSCCVYGHNEFDLSLMKSERYQLNAEHVKEYTKLVGKSEPQGDFDDRLSLYAIRNDIVVAGMWDRWAHLRDSAKHDMRLLLDKFPTGYEALAVAN